MGLARAWVGQGWTGEGVAEEEGGGSGRVGFCVTAQMVMVSSCRGIYGAVKRGGREWSVVTSFSIIYL
jgi:hypothetical protein